MNKSIIRVISIVVMMLIILSGCATLKEAMKTMEPAEKAYVTFVLVTTTGTGAYIVGSAVYSIATADDLKYGVSLKEYLESEEKE